MGGKGAGFPGCSAAEVDGKPPVDTLLYSAIVALTPAARAIKGACKVAEGPGPPAPQCLALMRHAGIP